MTLFEPEPPRRVRNRSRRRAFTASVLSTALALSIVGGGVYLLQHPQPIIDQVTVWQFEPTSAIHSQVTRLALTDHGRFLYYASRPEINDGDEFDSLCPKQAEEEDFGILGCYLPVDKQIHLYDVIDARLDGTEEVTAAHELLHAAWDRLGERERDDLAPLIEAAAEKLSADPEFASRMEYYARSEPGERINELHSIIGTEVEKLSPKLETYYAKYFSDRSVVTALHTAANAVFVDIKERSQGLVTTLEELRNGIEADYTKYTVGYDSLNSDIIAFNARADEPPERGGFISPQEFYDARAALNTRQNKLDDLYTTITQRSDEFETLLSQLEALNAEMAELQRGLNVGGEVQPEA